MSQQEADDQTTGERDPEEMLELSAETRDILEERGLRPLWEVEKDFGTVYDDLEPDIWTWEEIQTAIDGIEEDVPIADLPPGLLIMNRARRGSRDLLP